ncbi:acid phosphatase [Paenibacillus crassostreae]|uniref:Phospholipid phosphatase n=1 Tax=Paenibacillus crassostreae TaxID=1763538 RepID=A0A167G3U4_9BACL|nr:phosphatase PAP2 family protein [Paenibacillus crassostreae]AOZ90877.1 phospholipid phosphatase [Paenibacillus crassostreae]OAB77185.1 phospholipid phosphatase [Paenibacillus crassostreae]
MKSLKKQVIVAVLSVPILLSSLGGSYVNAASTPATVTPPSAPSWGYFVDNYKNNKAENKTVDSNPALGLLSEFNNLWTAGTTWNTGTKLNDSVLNLNILKVFNTSVRRTAEEADAAYLDDRRKQSYSVIDGLGSLADTYRAKAEATTTIKDVAADATTQKYSDEGNNAGSEDSELGNMVGLINTLRGTYSTTNPAKAYFNYPRPFRWVDNSLVVSTLIPVQNSDPSNDGGFPSGHTNAAYLSAIAMAYAVPERYQELLTRASDLGNSRIVAGMHSPLDVMGGRVMATALSAAILSDPDNNSLKTAAYQEAHSELLTQTATATATDLYSDYVTNKKNYTDRLTYGFSQIGSTTSPMIVPKGAEVLLETRQPYLDSTQRRWVLATTGLPSGYPVLDDAEGWGRLNLYAAADGYGALVDNVTVTMDAQKGGFHALDSWRNNISGVGKLTKKGTGTLKLEGNNTYSGGTLIEQGILQGDSKTAFGTASVTNNGGTLLESVEGQLIIGENYQQSAKGTLELSIGSKNDLLHIKKVASFNGKLRLNFTDGYVPVNGTSIITFDKQEGSFSDIETVGLPSTYKVKVVYASKSVQIEVSK